ncbi:hypothetical protein M409DRAFT_15888 [Zasmidium cellare ATCC 36951]|uniref:Myb-like domain-containing protein n=1 Tax=Zasmidium cellare ATCC 36951 TaxID=1080233 RepID=A0A6A6D5G3_ZASCE|nr:uncharacterized protein M409DRAFT_15888 [Zasmidium cellare ATCC 36951]KAF2173610.1 hypothetical protein M409DRAFT_15888 [Zasmidium cellare ATCC 36951]
MDSSQDVERQTAKKRRKKKRQSADEDSFIPNSQQTTSPTTNSSPLVQSIEAARRKNPNSKKWNDNDDPLEIARRDLQKWLKRKQMQEAVLENRARWVQMPNNKWGIKFYKPGEAPEKELTEVEAARLRLVKGEMERYRQSLEASQQAEGKKEQGMQTDEKQGEDADNAKPARQKRKKSEASEKGAADEVQQAPGRAANVEDASIPARAAAENEEPTESKRAKKRKRRSGEEVPVSQSEPALEAQEPRRKKKKQKTQDEPEQVSEPRRPMQESARNAELLQKGLQANAENVAAWLASQDDPEAPPESNAVDAVEGASGDVKPNKRKRVSRYVEDDEEDYDPSKETTESIAPTTTAPTTSAPKASGKSKSSGAFTAEEKVICDLVFGQVQQKLGLSDAELKAQIQQWRTAGIFKAELEEALPNRSKAQIRKFAQRRYHPYERGAWTADQDEALRDAHARWPGQWTKIRDLVDRSAGDCKDRWVKHIQFGDDKATGPWSQKEEIKLLEAVEECIETIKKERSKDRAMLKDRERLESMINWQTVSDKVAGGRSSKRCREKFEKLKAREQKGEPVVAAEQESTSASANDAAKEASKEKGAKKLLEGFEIGDYYDVFAEVHTAFKDHSAHFHDERNVLWSIVAQKNQASRFNTTWLGGALRRVAVETALKDWPINSKKIKRKIEQAETIPAKALQLAKLVEKRCADDTASLPRTFKPELIGKTAAEIVMLKMASKKQQSKKEDLSKEIVSDSEAEEDGDVLQESKATEEEQEQEVPETSEDELISPENDIRRDPSPTRENEQDEDEAAPESDGSVYEEKEDHEEDEDDASDNDAAQVVPEPQAEEPEPKRFRRPRVPKREDDIPVSSINSRVGMDSTQASPSLSPEAFLQRCRTAGKRQHEEYVATTSGGSKRRR